MIRRIGTVIFIASILSFVWGIGIGMLEEKDAPPLSSSGLLAVLLSDRGVPGMHTAVTVLSNQSEPPANLSVKHSSPVEPPSPVVLPGDMETVKVVRVVDGDTITVEINGQEEYLRYIGIDTPETVDPRKPVQCFGVEASKKNKELVEGETVRLEKDITDRDKYNRLLRYVWLGGTLINRELIVTGFAKSYSYPPDIKYQNEFMVAEKQARENQAGLWSACGSSAKPASVIRLPAVVSPENPSCTIKGNINASGEKIYHMHGCGSYEKTTINETRGEKWFCSEAEALSAGWRKAGNCL